jgi:hypothetical protein
MGLDIMAHACNPSYVGGIGKKIMFSGQVQAKNTRPYLKVN